MDTRSLIYFIAVAEEKNIGRAAARKALAIMMMLAAFGNMETIHIAAYALLLETIGMPESEFGAFMEYEAMRDKHDYMGQFGVDSDADICRTLAMFGGFYSVPLYALIQSRSQPSHRARIIAANNILNSLFMIVSALMAMGLTAAGFSIPAIFLVTALLNIVVATYIYSLVPEFLLRFIAWVLVHTFYRIRLVHAERIPEEGAAVLVCNHVSFVDAIVIMAESPRPIRFVMDHQIFKSPFAGWVFRHAKAIPIAPAHQDPALLARAYERCAEALAERQQG